MVRMIDEFYTQNKLIGKSVRVIEELYKGFCMVNDIEPLNNIISRLCNKYDLYVHGGILRQ